VDASKTFTGVTATLSGHGMDSNSNFLRYINMELFKEFCISAGNVSNRLKFATLAIISNAKCAQIYGAESVISSCLCTAAYSYKSPCWVRLVIFMGSTNSDYFIG
jgi:hypothetical protein